MKQNPNNKDEGVILSMSMEYFMQVHLTVHFFIHIYIYQSPI